MDYDEYSKATSYRSKKGGMIFYTSTERASVIYEDWKSEKTISYT